MTKAHLAVKLDLTGPQAKALVNCLDMVLSIQGSILKGDPDHAPLVRIEKKVRSLLTNQGRRNGEQPTGRDK